MRFSNKLTSLTRWTMKGSNRLPPVCKRAWMNYKDDEVDDQEQHGRRNCLVFPRRARNRDKYYEADNVCMPGITQCEPGVERHRSKPYQLGGHYPQVDTHHCEVHILWITQYCVCSETKTQGNQYSNNGELDKQRSYLLKKALASASITAPWTIDGRMVCLLASGRKVIVTNERQLNGLLQEMWLCTYLKPWTNVGNGSQNIRNLSYQSHQWCKYILIAVLVVPCHKHIILWLPYYTWYWFSYYDVMYVEIALRILNLESVIHLTSTQVVHAHTLM